MPIELPLGVEVDWTPVERPARGPLRGSHILVRPVDAAADARALFSLSHVPDGDPTIWTYLPDGQYESPHHLRQMLARAETSEDPLYFTLVDLPNERPLGMASYLRIAPEFGVIEIGHIWFGVPLQRTTAATEAIYLMAAQVFDDLGYRRLEWKCNALNAASRRAAERFGFSFEGIFRNHQVVKGRTATPRGTRSLTTSGQRSAAPSARGLRRRTNSDGLQKRMLGDLIAEARL